MAIFVRSYFSVILKGLLAIAYLILGGFLLLRTDIITFLSKPIAIVYALVLIAYGLFRGYGTYKEWQETSA